VKTNVEGQFTLSRLCQGKLRLQAFAENESQVLTQMGELDTVVSDQPVTIAISKWFPQCGLPGPGPWSLQGKSLPPLPDLKLHLDRAKSKGRKILLCFWRQDSQESRHFMQMLIHMAPEFKRRGFYIVALRVPTSDDELVSSSLIDFHMPFLHGELLDSESCLNAWGFSAGWLPWVIMTNENHIVTKEHFGLQILRQLQRSGSAIRY
jgi:hypothetical protein